MTAEIKTSDGALGGALVLEHEGVELELRSNRPALLPTEEVGVLADALKALVAKLNQT
jgi:hypothetical protein